jgi:hypothetical protein
MCAEFARVLQVSSPERPSRGTHSAAHFDTKRESDPAAATCKPIQSSRQPSLDECWGFKYRPTSSTRRGSSKAVVRTVVRSLSRMIH